MGHYKSNLRDIEFNLFEVFGRADVLGSGPYEELDADTAREMLKEYARLAENELAESFADADRNPPVFDPETHTAPVPESFKKSYQAWMDAEYWRLGTMAELGGTPARPLYQGFRIFELARHDASLATYFTAQAGLFRTACRVGCTPE